MTMTQWTVPCGLAHWARDAQQSC